MQARRGVLILTAGGDLVGRRNVGKIKRTKYCEVDKAYFSFKQAIPGSSLPSNNSSEAPPPVEM